MRTNSGTGFGIATKVVTAVALTLVVGAVTALPAQADPHPGQSQNVGIIDGTSVINGGSFPTTTSGPTGSFTDFTFTNVPVGDVGGSTLASFDTILLNVASPGMGCNADTLSAGQQADLVSFLNGGGKLVIYDSECAPQDYSWLPHPFATSNPGALGGTGTVNIVEDNLLGSDIPGEPHFIDEVLLGEETDAVGDMNVLTTQDPNVCLQMSGTNAADQSGATHVYYQFGAGLLIYNGFDVDFMDTGTSPDAADPAGNIAKIWLQELQQPLNGQGLACAAAVVGISLAPRQATNQVGTPHTVTATRTDDAGNPVPGDVISFQVSGAHAGATGTCNPASCATDSNGQVTFTYTGTTAGDDQIVACFTPSGGGNPVCSSPASKKWVGAGPPPPPPGTGVFCHGREVTINGTAGDDVLTGTAGADVMSGNGGNDTITGLEGNDTICGRSGNDKVIGSEGNDYLLGGKKKDRVRGDDGNDFVRGQTGKDKLRGGEGNDKLIANKGADGLKGNDGNDNLKGANGDDRLFAGFGNDKLDGGNGDNQCFPDGGDNTVKNCD